MQTRSLSHHENSIMAHQKQQKIKTRRQAVAGIADLLPHTTFDTHRPFPIGGPLERSLYL